jgi:hypothetical protein
MLDLLIILILLTGALSYLYLTTKKKIKNPGCCGQNCNCHENQSNKRSS